jgi:hypothetical protein
MRLYEEYFRRHSILDVPIVHHCFSGSLILKTTDHSVWQSNWVVVSINWIKDDHHPGHYCITTKIPIHNGFLNENNRYNNFFIFPSYVNKNSDEYEDFFFDWCDNLKSVIPITDSEELILSIWEMFVFCHDDFFVKQSKQIKIILFESLDKNNSMHDRNESRKKIIDFISTNYPKTLRIWNYEFLVCAENYSYWLADLVNNN